MSFISGITIFMPVYIQKELCFGTTIHRIHCVENFILNCSCLTLSALGSDLLSLFVGTQHTNHHCLCVFGCVFFCVCVVCVCTVLSVSQPIWQYLLSLLQALVRPCCLRSAAALWCPLTIMPKENGDYEGN